MSIPVLVFARMDSNRLPGKALIAIAGKTLLARVIDRAKRAASAGPVIVCTSERDIDDPIVAAAVAEGAEIARGSVEDVLGRALRCAKDRGLENFIRISGDSPFMDPAVIDRLADIHRDVRPDLTTNISPRTFPPGVSVEVINVAALKRVAETTTDAEDREHVTRYFYAHPADFTIRNETAPQGPFDGIDLTVDTDEDLKKAEWIAERLPQDAGYEEAVALAREYLNIPVREDGD